jgi:2-oxoisovalerate dehydrogenase E1 component alpha subunit
VAEVRERIGRAIKEAEAFPPRPPLETMFEGVYAEPLWQQREQLEEIRAAIAADPRVSGVRPAG